MFAYHYLRATFILALFLPVLANVPHCSDRFRQAAAEKMNSTNCKKQTLGAEFAWNYLNSSRRLEILFGASLHGDIGWLAWGLNPRKEAEMIGTRALIGIKLKNGTSVLGTYNVTGATKLGCKLLPSDIDLEVHNFSFSYMEEIELHMIHATIILPQKYNDSSLNLVWQIGNAAAGNQPYKHPTNIQNSDCRETIDLISGSVRGEADKLQKLRKAHGILNIVGWGTLLPLGVIVARYFRRFPMQWRGWFCLHISCQILGYILGTCGWIIGILLGNASKHHTYHTHRILGIIIFTFATLQMLALRLKPTSNDEYRVYWSMYHHFLGYALLAVISVNIFQGIAILNADHTWKLAYIGVLGMLGFIAVVLEIFTWIRFLVKFSRSRESHSDSRVVSQSNHGEGSISGTHKVSSQKDSGASIVSASQSSAKRDSS